MTAITHVLVTGGNGFVMSNVVRRLLRDIPDSRATVVDLARPADPLLASFLDDVASRVAYVEADVRVCGDLRDQYDLRSVTHVVHGAAVTHERAREIESPADYTTINIGGTVAVLDLARSLPSVRRFIHVSSGAVYGSPTGCSPTSSQPEGGPFNPPEMYAITKFAAELIARRYAALSILDVVCVRLSDVFGPMERPTLGRAHMSLPYRLARAIVERRRFRVDAPTLTAGGDFISSEDVAAAVIRLVTAPALPFDAYNIASGVWTKVKDVLAAARELHPGFDLDIVSPGESEYLQNPADRLARWNAYSIRRISQSTGWTPRSLHDQLASYLEWVCEDPEARCPPSTEAS